MMDAFAAHFAFEFRVGVRNKMLLFLNYLFPLGLYLMLGFILTGLNPFFREVIIPGMVAEVDILTGKKSILAYLMKPLTRAKSVAFTER